VDRIGHLDTTHAVHKWLFKIPALNQYQNKNRVTRPRKMMSTIYLRCLFLEGKKNAKINALAGVFVNVRAKTFKTGVFNLLLQRLLQES
jgi:hypothetical protein